MASTHLIAHLAHLLLLLKLHRLCLIRNSDTERDSDQQRRRGQDEDGLAAEPQPALRPRHGRLEAVGELAARCRRDHVLECVDAVEDGFGRVEVELLVL